MIGRCPGAEFKVLSVVRLTWPVLMAPRSEEARMTPFWLLCVCLVWILLNTELLVIFPTGTFYQYRVQKW